LAPAGVGGGANYNHSSSESSGSSVTKTEKTTRIHISVTYREGEDTPVNQQLIFELMGASQPIERLDSSMFQLAHTTNDGFSLFDSSDYHRASDMRTELEEAERRKKEDELRRHRLAEARERRKRILEEYYKRPVHTLEVMQSDIDGKYYTYTEEIRTAFKFLDQQYLPQRNLLSNQLSRSKDALEERIKLLRDKQAFAKRAIDETSKVLESQVIDVTQARQLRETLTSAFNAACEKPQLHQLPDVLLHLANQFSTLGAHYQNNLINVGQIVEIAPLVKKWDPYERKIQLAKSTVEDAGQINHSDKQCESINRLYEITSLRLSQQILKESDRQLAALLGQISDDIAMDIVTHRNAVFKATELKEAGDHQAILERTIDRNRYTDSVRRIEIMQKKLEHLDLSRSEYPEVVSEVERVYVAAIAKWEAFSNLASPSTMIAARVKRLQSVLDRIRQRGLQLSSTQRAEYHSAWIAAVIDGDLALFNYCYDPAVAFEPSCWVINTASDLSPQVAENFDRRLNRFEGSIELFWAGHR